MVYLVYTSVGSFSLFKEHLVLTIIQLSLVVLRYHTKPMSVIHELKAAYHGLMTIIR